MKDRVLEAALWYSADNPFDKKRAREGVIRAFFTASELYGVTFSPIEWEDVDPMSPRVPDPPKEFKNPRCLIGAAKVNGKREEVGDFTNDLVERNIVDLRQATRRAFYRACGGVLDDEECDAIINEHAIDIVKEDVMH